jgi:hypothetical protein
MVASNFANMRAVLAFLSIALCLHSWAQATATSDTGEQLNYVLSVTTGPTAERLHEHALEAWTWTFGVQPGARILRVDGSTGEIDATARFNFRSAMLTMREETMGVVEYKVTIRTGAGECRVQVSDLTHTGNRSTTLGGVHAGPLTRHPGGRRIRGMSRMHGAQLQGELVEASDRHMEALFDAFEARLRANAGQ